MNLIEGIQSQQERVRTMITHYEAIELDGRTVLQLNPGTTRNEEEIDKIIDRLNGADKLAALRKVREKILVRQLGSMMGPKTERSETRQVEDTYILAIIDEVIKEVGE